MREDLASIRQRNAKLLQLADAAKAAVIAIAAPEGLQELDALLAGLDDDDDDPVVEPVQFNDGNTIRVAQPEQQDAIQPPISAQTIQFPSADQPRIDAVERPLVAPAFRVYPALPQLVKGRAYSPADDANLIQQRMDDFEWLHRRGHRVRIDTDACDGRARHLLTAPDFDADLARAMAADRRLSGDKFVALLHLPDALEAEMQQLRSTRSKQQRRDIAKRLPAVEASLQCSVANSCRPEQARHIPQWLTVWHCMRLVGDSPSAIGRMYEAMTGVPMDKSHARKLRDEVKKRLGRA
jgi:hypothetical protein